MMLTSGGFDNVQLYAGGADARLRWSSVDDYSRDSYKIMRFELGTAWNQIFALPARCHPRSASA